MKDGILVTGISDLASATELGTTPTGSGRRQSPLRLLTARKKVSNTGMHSRRMAPFRRKKYE